MRRDGLVTQNPLELVPPPPAPAHRVKPPSPEDVGAVLAQAAGYHYEAILWTIAMTGLRSEEARGLRPHNVNLTDGWLEVERVLIRHKGAWLLEAPKNDASANRAAIPAALAVRLAEHLAAWQPSPLDPFGLLFVSLTGRPIGDAILSRELDHLCHAAGVPYFSTHRLRHAAATTLLNLPPGERPSLEQVSRMLRHGSVSTTADIYGHVLDSTLHGLAGQLEGAYSAPVGDTSVTAPTRDAPPASDDAPDETP